MLNEMHVEHVQLETRTDHAHGDAKKTIRIKELGWKSHVYPCFLRPTGFSLIFNHFHPYISKILLYFFHDTEPHLPHNNSLHLSRWRYNQARLQCTMVFICHVAKSWSAISEWYRLIKLALSMFLPRIKEQRSSLQRWKFIFITGLRHCDAEHCNIC